MKHPDIPKWPYLFFKWFCNESFFEELQGDLEENFLLNQEKKGIRKARKIYRKEILKLIRPSVIQKKFTMPRAIGELSKNYVLTSIRAVKHNPGYILSNIIGLAFALSIATIGYFNFRFNYTFNHYYEENAPFLFKVHGLRTGDYDLGSSTVAIAPALKASGINAIRYHHETIAVKKGNRLIQESTAFADPGFIESFRLESVSGRKIRILNDDEVFISEKTATKLFGEPYPVGELVEIVYPNEKERSYIVKDVYKDPPRNNSFHFPMITSFENYLNYYEVEDSDWSQYIDGTFVHLATTDPGQVEQQLQQYLIPHNENNPDRQIEKFQLENILTWPAIEFYLAGSSFVGYLHPASVIGTVSTAFAILLLACFNFINTSIALSGKRLKEIAVRKVMGGTKGSTVAQFMTENSMMVAFAVLLSFGISSFLIPAYNSLLTQEIVQLDQVPVSTILLFSISLILFVTLLSGAYPSFYISKFSSLQIFRNKVTIRGKNKLMVILLTFQFALCFYNFTSLYITVDNSYYQESLDRGYELSQVVNIPLNEPSQLEEMKNEFVNHPDILQVEGASYLIGFNFHDNTAFIEGFDHEVAELVVGQQYPEMLGLRLTKGSFFSENKQFAEKEVVVNQMVEDIAGTDILNKVISLEGERYRVAGVVEDFNLRHIMFTNRIKPVVIRVGPEENFRYASIHIQGLAQDANKEIELLWYKLFPYQLYRGFVQERVLDNIRETNHIMININLISSIITILISALGLYTLIALSVQKRSKEFGIRKVLGASKKVIIALLGKDLYWILGIAMVIGLSGGYYVINIVFDIIYAYHIPFGILHIVLPALALFVIVALTIGYKVWQTGKLNPVEQLRME